MANVKYLVVIINTMLISTWASLVAQLVICLQFMRPWFNSWVGKKPWRRDRLCCACLVAQSCPTPCNHMDCSPPGSSIHGDSPGQNTGMSCHALLQGIFPTKGWKPGLPPCRCVLYHLSHQGSPGIGYPLLYSGVSLVAQTVKIKSACNVGDLGSIPGLERSPEGGLGNPVKYSCLENPHGQRSLTGYSPWGHKKLDIMSD